MVSDLRKYEKKIPPNFTIPLSSIHNNTKLYPYPQFTVYTDEGIQLYPPKSQHSQNNIPPGYSCKKEWQTRAQFKNRAKCKQTVKKVVPRLCNRERLNGHSGVDNTI